MNKNELIIALKSKFFKVDDTNLREGKTEEGITVWGISVFDKNGDVITKQNLTFYTIGKEDTSDAFWGVSEPKPNPIIPEPNFRDRIDTYIKSKIDDNSIQFGYVMEVSELTQRALGIAIMSDKSEKKILLLEDIEGNFTLIIL